MKLTVAVLAASIVAAPAAAQNVLAIASPIPEGAEKTFCYYQGMAHSEGALIVVTGSNTLTESTPFREERMLRCARDEDDVMKWIPGQLGR